MTARGIGKPASKAFTAMMKPLTLVAATRNAIACTPLAVDVMTNELKVSRASCELFIPLGFAILRISFVLHFVAATIFLGALVGRSFSISEMLLIGVLSAIASFGTIGLNGPAGLASLPPFCGRLRSPMSLPCRSCWLWIRSLACSGQL
jgi:Na+/H+-dicarboxylate symporter